MYEQKDIDFIKSFLKSLTDSNIEYCILRKANMILTGRAHDIDMVVDVSKINNVYKILSELSKELGWKLFLRTEKDNGNLVSVHYFATHEEQIYIVHFDLFINFSWKAIPILKNRELLLNKIEKDSVYSCSASVEAITKLFSRYLHHGYIKDEYKEDIFAIFLNNNSEIVREMSQFLDKDTAELIYDLVMARDWNGLIRLNQKVQDCIQFRYYNTSPKRKLMDNLNSKLFKLKRYFNHKGVMVAFLGTDGSGKSTIISNLSVVLERTFDESQIKYYHWRPKYIKSPKGEKGSSANVTNPHSNKPYSKVTSFIKFMYFNLDYIFGYWFSVKVHLGKNQLVVFDRYYYDYMLDKYRYRLNLSDSIINAFIPLIPKPDITFLLFGDPNILYERKKEITVEEVEKQINRILDQKNNIPNSRVVDVNQSVENVVFDTSTFILEFMENREL